MFGAQVARSPLFDMALMIFNGVERKRSRQRNAGVGAVGHCMSLR